MTAALAPNSAVPAAKRADDAGPRNDRSIFAYMVPPANAAPEVKEQHAQCFSCRMLVPKSAMPADGEHKKGCDLCVIVGSQEGVDGAKDRGSCDEFASWPTPDATPDQDVVAEHAKKLASGAPGSATKEEIGYVERKVRCENCFFGAAPKCNWFAELSEKMPEYFHDDRPIEPKACCNSQTPKGGAEDEVVAEIDADDQALDSTMAMDRRTTAVMDTDSRLPIAMDRDSVREKTRDGRLIVKRTHVTKANVCPYRGQEIPGWEALGLEPDRIYNLLRDPEELRKGAPTLNGVQLLIKHTPVTADDPHQDKTVGSLGSEAEFDGEYLDNSLFVNVREAIDGIETGKMRELSAGYHYKPDMTPGNFDGMPYDGVMREIVFNHVALVEDGRAGPDVLVADSALKEIDMAKPTKFAVAVLNFTAAKVAPLLAMDSGTITLPKGFRSVTPKNFNEAKPKLLSELRIALDGKLRKGLALDATMKDFAKAIDAFGGIEEATDAEEEEVETSSQVGPLDKPEPNTNTEKPQAFDVEPMKSFMREKGMGEDDIKKVCDMMPAEWQNVGTNQTKTAVDSEKEVDEKDKDLVSKPAMDEAIKTAVAEVRKTERAIRSAIAEVHPWTGDLPATLAFDSAADVFRHALVMKNVEGAKTMHADALQAVLKTLPRNGARAPEQVHTGTTIAMDAIEKAKSYAPGIEHISSAL